MHGALGGAIVLSADGTGTSSGALSEGTSLKWRVEGDHIVVERTGAGRSPSPFRARLSDDGKSLVAEDGNTRVVLVRQ